LPEQVAFVPIDFDTQTLEAIFTGTAIDLSRQTIFVIERRSDIECAEKLMEVVAKRGAPWLFGPKPANTPSFLKPLHLNLLEDVGNAEYQARYLKPLERNLVVTEAERIVQATVIRPRYIIERLDRELFCL
jgi:O-methyltransferase involved in polyketide biosynthesis